MAPAEFAFEGPMYVAVTDPRGKITSFDCMARSRLETADASAERLLVEERASSQASDARAAILLGFSSMSDRPPSASPSPMVSTARKAHHLAHQTFTDIDALDRAIHHAVDELNVERTVLPLAEPRISAMKIASHALASRRHHFHP